MGSIPLWLPARIHPLQGDRCATGRDHHHRSVYRVGGSVRVGAVHRVGEHLQLQFALALQSKGAHIVI